MDKQYSREFFSSLVSALQDVCRVYLDFNESVDVSGYLAVELDGRQRERYVLSELINASGTGVSESYCIKAFKTMQPMARNSSELMIGVKRRRKDSLERQLDMVISQQSPCPSTSGSDCGVRGYRSSLEGASDNAVSGSHSRDSSPVQNLLKALRHHSTYRGSEVGFGPDVSLPTDKEALTGSNSRECSREVCPGRESNQKSFTIPNHTCQCCQQGNDPVSLQHPMEAQDYLHSHESMSNKRNKPRSGVSLDTSKDQSKQSKQKSALERSHSPDSYRAHRTLSDQNLTKPSGVPCNKSKTHKSESKMKDTENTAVKVGRPCSNQSQCSSGMTSSETPQSPIPFVTTAGNMRSAKEDKVIASDKANQPAEKHSELTTCRNSVSHCGAGSESIRKSVSTDKCGRNTAAQKMGVMTDSLQNTKSNTDDVEASPAKSKTLKRHLASDSGLDPEPTVSLCRRRHLEIGDGEVRPKTDSCDQLCQEGDSGGEADGEFRMVDDHNDGSPVKKDPDKFQKLTQKKNGKVKKFKSSKMTCSDLLKHLVKPIESSRKQAKECSKQRQSEEFSRCGTKSTHAEEPITCGRKSTDSKDHNSCGTKNTGSVVNEQNVYIPSKTLLLNDEIDDIVIKEEVSDIKSESDSQGLVIDMGDEEQDIEGDDDDDDEDTNDLCAGTDSELDAIDRNVRTAQKTRYHLNLLTSHLLTWSETRPVEDIPCNKLDTFLSTFFATVRKETGDDYEPMSLSSIQSSIDRHLRKARYPYSIKKDRQFAHSRSVLEARQRLLGSRVEKKQRCPAQITEREITRLYTTGQLGMETPHALLNTAWFLNNIHFGLSSSMEHYYLKWGDMSLETDADGREWLLMTRRKPGGEESVVRVSASEGDPARCCVSVFKKYMSVRPPEMCKPDSPFYLTVNLHRRESQHWYRAQTMGYNKFGSNLRKMAAAAGLNSRKFSSTAVQLASET